MRPSVPNANALMSSSMVCSGLSKSTTCDRAAGTLQHPNTAHTSAHNPRSQRNRLREQGQIIDFLWSSLRFEYAHHQTRFSHSPSRNLSLTPALEKKPGKRCPPGQRAFQTAQSFKPRSKQSFRAKQADFFFLLRSCEGVGLRSRGISLRSLAKSSHSQSTLTTLSVLRPRPPHLQLPNVFQPLPQARFKPLLRGLVISPPRQIIRHASHVRHFFLEVMRILVPCSISNIFHQPRHRIS